ncbi:hypothetical protein G3R49_03550 [Shewanella sp. WXL01]|uniref:hypothetical protein n=1 Tax=Shewanella sp. WXL01 TaxID=2709721 RepID=UPI0014384F76|nr:hypothetical protein [Shewanella sp. WXL01]NKF49651.1 hypothetical protein [Shewanella sp. WXL01]
MAIWKSLYDVFDKERSRVEKQRGQLRALQFELEANIRFVASSGQQESQLLLIADKLESQTFDTILSQGFSFNNEMLKAQQIAGYAEFNRYVGRDSYQLVCDAYQRIKLIKKSPTGITGLKLKSLLRFLLLVHFHLNGKGLPSK